MGSLKAVVSIPLSMATCWNETKIIVIKLSKHVIAGKKTSKNFGRFGDLVELFLQLMIGIWPSTIN